MSNDDLIADLSIDLAPVRRRSVWRDASWLAALGAAELAMIAGTGLMRSDMGQLIGSPYMQWKLISLGIVAGIALATALASSSPTTSPRCGLAAALLLAAAAMIVGLFIRPAPTSPLAHDTHLPHSFGPFCALAIVMLSLPILSLLAVQMRRGAPVLPEESALAAGLAAGSWGALVFSLCCPSNDPVYVILWYGAGCALVGAAARWLLPRRFRL